MKARNIEDKTMVLLRLGLLHLSARQETGLTQKIQAERKGESTKKEEENSLILIFFFENSYIEE